MEQLLEITEMKTLRKLINKTMRDRICSEDIRQQLEVEPINGEQELER